VSLLEVGEGVVEVKDLGPGKQQSRKDLEKILADLLVRWEHARRMDPRPARIAGRTGARSGQYPPAHG
jgi:hypothetical protein